MVSELHWYSVALASMAHPLVGRDFSTGRAGVCGFTLVNLKDGIELLFY